MLQKPQLQDPHVYFDACTCPLFKIQQFSMSCHYNRATAIVDLFVNQQVCAALSHSALIHAVQRRAYDFLLVFYQLRLCCSAFCTVTGLAFLSY
jgi:hypothetical protein